MLFILVWDCIGLVVVASAENHAAVGCLLAPTRGTDRPEHDRWRHWPCRPGIVGNLRSTMLCGLDHKTALFKATAGHDPQQIVQQRFMIDGNVAPLSRLDDVAEISIAQVAPLVESRDLTRVFAQAVLPRDEVEHLVNLADRLASDYLAAPGRAQSHGIEFRGQRCTFAQFVHWDQHDGSECLAGHVALAG